MIRFPAPANIEFANVAEKAIFLSVHARGDSPLHPILCGKHLIVLASRGEFGFGPGGLRESMNHLEPHIGTCSRYLGVETWDIVEIEYQEFGDERHRRSVAEAHGQVKELVSRLAMPGLDQDVIAVH